MSLRIFMYIQNIGRKGTILPNSYKGIGVGSIVALSEAIGALFGLIGAEVGSISTLVESINVVGVRLMSAGVGSIGARVRTIGTIVGRSLIKLDRLRH